MNKKNIIITIMSVLLLTCIFAFARTTTTDLVLTLPIWEEDTDILADYNANFTIIEDFANDVLEYDLSPVLRANLDISTFNIEGVDATEFGYLNGISSFGGTLIDDASASAARTTLSAAVLGANNDITSISGLSGAIATPTNISMTGELDMTGANVVIDLNPVQVGTVQVIDITPTAILTTNEATWIGIQIDGNILDPSGNDIGVYGMCLDFSTFSPSGAGVHVDGYKVEMADITEHALHIINGRIVVTGDIPSTAIAQFTGIDFRYSIDNMVSTSMLHAIDVAVTEGVPLGDIVAVATHSHVDVIHQHIGTFTTPDQVGTDSFAGIYDNSETNYTAGINTIEMFVANSDAIWIGDGSKFDELEVDMSSDATKTISPTFWYWKTAAWEQFYPADDTDGFQHSGLIRWVSGDLTGWSSADPADTEGETGYWISVVRTANADPGTPTAETIKTGAVTLYSWDKTGDLTVKDIDAASLLLDTALPAIEGGTGKATITADSFLKGAAGNTYVERTIAEVITDLALDSDDLSDVDTIAMLDENEEVTGYWIFTDYLDIDRAHNTYSPNLAFERSRDGDDNVGYDDCLGEITFHGYHTGYFEMGAMIRSVVDETPGDSDMPGRLEFLTTPDGSDTPSLRMTIKENGDVFIGDGPWTNYVKITAAGVMTLEGTANIEGVNDTEMGYLSTVSSNVQTQIAARALKGANTDITSILNTGLYVGRDGDNKIDWGTDDRLKIKIAGTEHSIASIADGASDSDTLVTKGYVDDEVDTKEDTLTNEVGLYSALSDVTEFIEAGDDIIKNYYSALSSDHTYSANADVDSQPVGEDVNFGDLLYKDWTLGEWMKAQADDFATTPALRIALETKGDGDTCLMLVKGYIRDDDFDFSASRIFLNDDSAGTCDEEAPGESGDQIQVVGTALSADILFFDPSIDVGEI